MTYHAIPARCETCRHWRLPVHDAGDGWGFCTLGENVRRNQREYLPVHRSGYCTSHTPRPEQVRK
jgi:hypothetical protein